MSEDVNTNETTNEAADNQETTTEMVKLAGKFNDVESLEKGYKDLEKHLGARSGVQQEYDALKSATVVPESYESIENLEIDSETLISLQENAKVLGLNQSQYAKYVDNFAAKQEQLVAKANESVATKVEKYGENGYKQLASYIKSEHGLSENTISNLSDEELLSFSKRRTSFMESSIDTGSHYGGRISGEDVSQAYAKFNQLPPGTAKNEAYNKWVKLSEMKNG